MNDLLIRLFISSLVLFALEIAKNSKSINKKIVKYMFNWSFPLYRPFSLVVAPMFSIAFLQLLLPDVGIGLPSVLFSLVFFIQPFFEEIIFRGIVLGGLHKKFVEGNKYCKNIKSMAILLVQSLLFVGIHLFEARNLFNLLGIFISGIIYGIIFLLSKKNVLPSTVLHLLNNFLIFSAVTLGG